MSSITRSAHLALTTFRVLTHEVTRLSKELGHCLGNALAAMDEEEVGNQHFSGPQNTKSLSIKTTFPFQSMSTSSGLF